MSSVTMTAVPKELETPVLESPAKDLQQAEINAPLEPEISVRTVAITAAFLLAIALGVLALGSYLLNQRLKTSAPQSSPRAAMTALSSRSC